MESVADFEWNRWPEWTGICNLKTIRQKTEEITAGFSNELCKGIPIRYTMYEHSKREYGTCNHTRILLYAYLDWMKKKCEGKNSFLRRDPDSGKPKLKDDDAPFLFDPRGGTFTHDPQIRRQYFQYRTALTLSLLDMSAVEKKDQVIRHLRETDAPIKVDA